MINYYWLCLSLHAIFLACDSGCNHIRQLIKRRAEGTILVGRVLFTAIRGNTNQPSLHTQKPQVYGNTFLYDVICDRVREVAMDKISPVIGCGYRLLESRADPVWRSGSQKELRPAKTEGDSTQAGMMAHNHLTRMG